MPDVRQRATSVSDEQNSDPQDEPVTTPPPDGLLGLVMEIGIERSTYPGLVRSVGKRPPHLTALNFDGELVTYGQLFLRVGSTARSLADQGVSKGSHVAVMMANSADTVIVHLALQVAGATAALLNTSLVGDSLRHLIE